MSTFSARWKSCMRGNGLPVPTVEDVHEALEFLDKLNQAMENAGGELEVTIGGLLAAGAFVGLDEAALTVLGDAAEVVAAVYLSACIGCLGSVAIGDLRDLFANNDVPGFVVAELNSQGIDLNEEAVA